MTPVDILDRLFSEVSAQAQEGQFCRSGLAVLEAETRAIAALNQTILHPDFAKACQLLLTCKGRVILMGVGKSGHIGKKIAASFASTGTPAFFVHPNEAIHGDLGMITTHDVVVMLSYSGETDELIALLPALSRKIKANEFEAAVKLQNMALEVGLILVIPATLALTTLSYPIISTLFERGEFTTDESFFVAKALMFYSFGLPSYVLVKVMEPAFFARGDTKTPMKIA